MAGECVALEGSNYPNSSLTGGLHCWVEGRALLFSCKGFWRVNLQGNECTFMNSIPIPFEKLHADGKWPNEITGVDAVIQLKGNKALVLSGEHCIEVSTQNSNFDLTGGLALITDRIDGWPQEERVFAVIHCMEGDTPTVAYAFINSERYIRLDIGSNGPVVNKDYGVLRNRDKAFRTNSDCTGYWPASITQGEVSAVLQSTGWSSRRKRKIPIAYVFAKCAEQEKERQFIGIPKMRYIRVDADHTRFPYETWGNKKGKECEDYPPGDISAFNWPLLPNAAAWKALEARDINALEAALQQSQTGLDQANNTGWTLLQNAALMGWLEGVQALLIAGADKNKAQNNGATPLILAAFNGHLLVVEHLCTEGADKDKALNDGMTPLFIAAQGGHLPVVVHLCTEGANKDKATLKGATPLYIASQNAHLLVVVHLCTARADKDKATLKGATPLAIAAEEGHLLVVEHLCAEGADKDKALSDGTTPLILATLQGHFSVAKHLCGAGADKSKARLVDGATPARIAFAKQDVALFNIVSHRNIAFTDYR